MHQRLKKSDKKVNLEKFLQPAQPKGIADLLPYKKLIEAIDEREIKAIGGLADEESSKALHTPRPR